MTTVALGLVPKLNPLLPATSTANPLEKREKQKLRASDADSLRISWPDLLS